MLEVECDFVVEVEPAVLAQIEVPIDNFGLDQLMCPQLGQLFSAKLGLEDIAAKEHISATCELLEGVESHADELSETSIEEFQLLPLGIVEQTSLAWRIVAREGDEILHG